MSVKFRTMKELKEKTPDVVRAAQHGDVVITFRGKPTVLLRRLGETELKGMLFLESRKVRRLLGKALDDARAGRTVPLDELITELSTTP